MNKKIKAAKTLNIISFIVLSLCFIFFLVFYINAILSLSNNESNSLGYVILYIVFLIYGSIANGISFILNLISCLLTCKIPDIKKRKYIIYTILVPIVEIIEVGLFLLLQLFIK